MILRGIFHVVSCFPLHFMLFRRNFDYFSEQCRWVGWFEGWVRVGVGGAIRGRSGDNFIIIELEFVQKKEK